MRMLKWKRETKKGNGADLEKIKNIQKEKYLFIFNLNRQETT